MTDPAPRDRIYHRHAIEGQRGYEVTRDGRKYIKLDLPGQEILRPFNDRDWLPDHERRPFTRAQIAQVAFAADKQLCIALGLHLEAKRDWLSMREEDRIAYIAAGPRDRGPIPGLRPRLFREIMKELDKYTVT